VGQPSELKPSDPARTGRTTRSSWADADNARHYAEFTRRFPMYTETSRDLVSRAGLSAGDVVVDLCCGTGATTEVILERLGPLGRVVAADGSAAMLEEARRAVPDPRVTFVQTVAESLRDVVRGPVDAVVCNSAIWQTDVATVTREVAGLLRPGGRFIFNIGRRFLIAPFTAEELGDRSPGLHDMTYAVAVLEHGFVPGRAGPPADAPRRPPLTVDGLQSTLEDVGFEVETDWRSFTSTVAQQQAWLSVPVFSPQTPGRDHDEKMEILRKAAERLGPDHTDEVKWLVVKATRLL
jgi:ubiquinone/menaquinone biosynthesis C-methylase UbiE